MGSVQAPWTEDQVNSLNEYQFSGAFHEYTCGKRDPNGRAHPLVATVDGWVCEKDPDYQQDWAHEFTLDWSWKALMIERTAYK